MSLDLRGGVGQHRDLPCSRARALDADLAALAQGEILRGPRGRAPLAARYGFLHRQRAQLSVKAQGDQRARRQRQRPGLKVIQIKRWFPSMARRLGPPLPDRARGQRAARPAGGQLRHLTQPPDRAEDQCNDESQQRHIAQRIGIGLRDPQVTLDRLRLRGPRGHTFLMGLPDPRRGCVARTNRLIVQKRPNGPPRQAGIQPRQGLSVRGNAKAPERENQCAEKPKAHSGQHTPKQITAQIVLRAHHQQRQHRQQQRQHRPKRLHQRLGPHPRPSQPQGPPQCAQPVCLVSGCFHASRSGGPAAGCRQSHSGMVSRFIISSKLGRGRITAN